jgi:hypothetical protein
MYRLIFFSLFLASSFLQAQTKKPVQKPKPVAVKDTLAVDTTNLVVEEPPILYEFAVTTKKPKSKKERTKLCLNLVSSDSMVVLNYCVNDSVLFDPEVSKILFQTTKGDSTYVLVYVCAFSKPKDKVECDAGKETKLFYVRWNTVSNKAVVKQKIIESCMRGIVNMTKEPIVKWDGNSPLVVNYYRGATDFIELKFDPLNFLKGMQSGTDN